MDFNYVSNTSQVIDLGGLVVKRNVPSLFDVARDLWDFSNTLRVNADIRVLLIKLVVSEPLRELTQLKHHEVNDSQLIFNQESLLP